MRGAPQSWFCVLICRISARNSISTRGRPAEWIARQLIEAFPWDGAPGYMIRDRDVIESDKGAGVSTERRDRAPLFVAQSAICSVLYRHLSPGIL
jgi:hypothetical protein